MLTAKVIGKGSCLARFWPTPKAHVKGGFSSGRRALARQFRPSEISSSPTKAHCRLANLVTQAVTAVRDLLASTILSILQFAHISLLDPYQTFTKLSEFADVLLKISWKMTISTSVFGKASAAETQKLVSRVYQKTESLHSTTRKTSTAQFNANGHNRAAKGDDYQTQRQLFMNILDANATKRDAKQFLARFKTPSSPVKPSISPAAQKWQTPSAQTDQARLDRIGVNLGGLYSPGRAIAEAPQFVRQEPIEQTLPRVTVSTALVCLRSGQPLDDSTLNGLALTLSQLVKLDMHIVLVLETDRPVSTANGNLNSTSSDCGLEDTAERLCQAIAKHSPAGARFVDGALELESSSTDNSSAGCQQLRIAVPRLVLAPLARRTIPIIPNLAYTATGQVVRVELKEAMRALSEGLPQQSPATSISSGPQNLDSISIDRIIILDQAGGIPSKVRGDGAHVFINLEQEFPSILDELSEYASKGGSEHLGMDYNSSKYTRQQDNLRMTKLCLANLPSASSALIISPQEAAASSDLSRKARGPETGTGTRRQKNALIHNLLTNKSLISSSLPIARLPGTNGVGTGSPSQWQTSTLVKRGMPLAIIPSPHRGHRWEEIGWLPPADGHTELELDNDPRINFSQLVYLIENSFRKQLNVEHYLQRIKGKVAGLIVAGDYEGAAILTWEQPPGTSDSSHLVPYLDKFAVLQSSQGSSGVADIMFQAMVRSCFPNGVCWRSRKDNPVNKWYFERSSATWQIPNSMWTMFWTGEGVVEKEARFNDYVGVCKNVVPSFYGSNPV